MATLVYQNLVKPFEKESSQTNKSVQVKVESFTWKKTFNIKLLDTVLDLKQNINDELEIPVEQQTLTFGKQVLKNSQTMSDLKIQSDDTIHLIQTDDENIKKVSYSSNKGYIEVVINKKLKMSVSKDDTVGKLKQEIRENFSKLKDIADENIKLSFKSKVIEDSSKSLGSYRVHPSSTGEKFNAENTIFVEAHVPGG
ncbi:polyubiquitin [Gigaspora margarita]|uniref:Polyubiquitin n=1 Tax=Gigaspora margarita TaxID=4874 RepID=A0A8H3X833_GIGMA|nr:polyubiquitin [Gigaspora margarita]